MKNMPPKLIQISKFLSFVLRHKPESIGLYLDPQGWAKIDELLLAAKRSGLTLDRSLLRQVVAHNDKQRFAFNKDGTKIRANQGHSIPIDLGLEPLIPPEFLYHGTAMRFIESIRKWGIAPQKRQHVHLSQDEGTAVNVGKRHGKPVVLVIQAGRMYEHGYRFYRSANGVWLTKNITPEYILFPKTLLKAKGKW